MVGGYIPIRKKINKQLILKETSKNRLININDIIKQKMEDDKNRFVKIYYQLGGYKKEKHEINNIKILKVFNIN